VLADIAKGKKHGVGSGYNMLGPGDVFGEIAFFTEVPQLEVRTPGGGRRLYIGGWLPGLSTRYAVLPGGGCCIKTVPW
jgi:CRP-like cAMP-binding protein